MLIEPFEEKYKEVLKQRLTLEGEVALWKQRYHEDIARYKQRANRYILLLLLLPLVALFFRRQTPPSVDWQPFAIQRDSLKNLLDNLEKTHVRQIKYIAQKGDTPASLGSLFYNNEKAAAQIIRDNYLDLLGYVREIKAGDTLKIIYR
jgi:hypothetical protein